MIFDVITMLAVLERITPDQHPALAAAVVFDTPFTNR